MADTTDHLKVMIEVMNTVINPVNQSLSRHSEAVQMAVSLIQRLVDLYTQEPSRSTIIKEVRTIMDEHDGCCKDRNTSLNVDAGRRVEEIVRKATEFMDKMMEDHEKQMKLTIETYEKEVKAVLTEHKTAMEKALEPVGKMKDKFMWLLTALGLGYAIGIGAFFYIHSVIGKVDGLADAVKALAPK